MCVEMTRLGELLHSMLFVGRWHLLYSIANAISLENNTIFLRLYLIIITINASVLTYVIRLYKCIMYTPSFYSIIFFCGVCLI